MKLKADVLWESDALKESIKFLEQQEKQIPTLDQKLKEFKARYQKEHGLPYGDATMEKIETFISWMKTNGAKFDKIRMRYYGPDYRGVHTVKDLQNSELFLHVPKKLIITRQAGIETPIGKKVFEANLDLSWDYLAFITIFLLTQFHDPKSFWKPYMDVYPKDVTNFPMFYSEKEKKMLTGCPILEHINDEIEEIKEEYTKILDAVPEFKEFTFEEYMYNKTLVISRIFYVTMHGQEERIMVPLADMFNHHYDRVGETYWQYDDKDDAFVVQAVKPIKSGDPICENYGQKPNYRFLFYYGFIIENNPKNCVYMKIYYNSNDPANKTKSNMLGASPDYYIRSFKFFEKYGDHVETNEKLMSVLRLIEFKGDLNIFCPYFTPVIANAYACDYRKRKLICQPLSLDNEKSALTKLRFIANKNLKKYPESYEHDMELLKNSKDLSFNEHNILVIRSDEKRIYKNIIEMADLGLKMLDMKTAAEAEALFTEKAAKTDYATYFRRSLLPFLHKVK